MTNPTAADLMLAWERGLDASPTRRALALLEAAFPGEAARLSALSIGTRDACLLSLRQSLFGDSAAAVAQCPSCSEQLDIALNIGDLYAQAPLYSPASHASSLTSPASPASNTQTAETASSVLSLRADGADIVFRLPNSDDILAMSGICNEGDAQHALLRRCVISVNRDGNAIPGDILTDGMTVALSQAMNEADPQACTELALTCPACGHAWHSPLDIVSFLWSEIHAWALRTLRDVHALARAYGWREADILAMSASRRQIYLELARS